MRTVWFLLLIASGCDGSHAGTGREPDEYTGCATDENWVTFDDAEKIAVADDVQAPQVSEPMAGATLPAAAKVVLAWRRSFLEAGTAAGDVPRDANCPQYNPGALTTLHFPPVSGSVYDLHFLIDGTLVHRVLTTLQKWAPTDATWMSWKPVPPSPGPLPVGKTVAVRIYRITLLRNDLKEGAFVGSQPFIFTVGN